MRQGDDRYLGDREADARLGEMVGPLRLVRRLGAGATGSVYLAEHAVLGTRRAVRFLPPRLTEDASVVRRFVEDARVAAGLRHRNLIQVHDVGQLASGAWYLTLDYLDGQTLGRFAGGHATSMDPALVLHAVCQIANALQVVHDHRMALGDLRPERVFLIPYDTDPVHAVLLGFGIGTGYRAGAGAGAGSGAGSLTAAARPYLAPEQLRGAPATPTADLHALAVIAYQMLTGGWFPHQHDESRQHYLELPADEVMERYATGRPVDLQARCPGLSAAFARTLHTALHVDPAQRPASAAAFAVTLAQALPESRGLPDGMTIVRSYAHELLDVFTPLPGEPPPRAPASEVASRYQLGPQLGAGGMAEVFAGTMIGAEGFMRRVAIKRVLSGLSHVPAFAMMFVAEAQIISRFSHPNIVSVLDFSRDAEGRFLLVMEYIDGTDLATLIDAGPIAPSLAIYIVVELLRGLGYAHALPDSQRGTRGVVHRDVSPQNLLLDYEGAVKLSDFGLARALAASEAACSGTLRGKPSYMAPEHVLGYPLDGRTDLFAVGVMLWQMLAQRALFTGATREIISQVMYRHIPAPGDLCPGVPPDLGAVAMKLLERDRDDRYPTAEAAIEALLRCDDVPRDGRGELVRVLAERFPRGGGRVKRVAPVRRRARSTTATAVPDSSAVE